MATTWLLQCSVLPGLWSDEVVVSANTAIGVGVSFFVPSGMIYGHHAGTGLVPVNVLERSGDKVMVSIPGIPLDSSQVVTVRQDQIQAA